jgi:D-amino peptidase
MRVHIISDMEGVAGIVRPEQTLGGHEMYEEGRKLYTEEINAAVRGAKAAGAKEIVVMDHHGAGKAWSFNSLVHDLLDPACEYVVQSSWTQYTEFLEEGCDACLLVGMHAMAGTPDGVMNHTVSGSLVTGDDAACREAKQLLGAGLTTVAVKKGLGARAARNLAPQLAREVIEEGARESLKDLSAVEPYDPGRPAEIEVDFVGTGEVDKYRGRAGVEVTGPRSIVVRADDWWTAWRNLFLEPSLP